MRRLSYLRTKISQAAQATIAAPNAKVTLHWENLIVSSAWRVSHYCASETTTCYIHRFVSVSKRIHSSQPPAMVRWRLGRQSFR